MIIWVASYPKSGNTFLRILLADYFFNNNENFDFNCLKQIQRYPKLNFLDSLRNNLNFNQIVKDRNSFLDLSYRAQIVNFNKKDFFLKTHSKNYEENQFKFTNKNITKACIYIVRDPRNVISSYADYYNLSLEKSYNEMINETEKYYQYQDIFYPTILGSWKSNLISWKKASNEFPVKIIKYEDLIKKTYEVFLDILNFLKDIGIIEKINKAKIKSTILKTQFENLQQLEVKNLFFEKNNSSKKPFFNLGGKRDWKKEKNLFINNIEEVFKNEMIDLGYL